MNIIDLSKTVKNQKVPAGSVIVLQGTSIKSVTILHSGLAELLTFTQNAAGKKPDVIIGNSIRVGLIKGESVCGISGLRRTEPHIGSIRTVTDCIISNIPVDSEKVLQLFQSNIKLNLQVLRALVQRIESAVYLFNNYRYLWHKLVVIQDSLAISSDPDPSIQQDLNGDRYSAKLHEYSAHIKSLLNEKGHKESLYWDHNIFLGRIQEDLDLYKEHDKVTVENSIDNQQFLFIKRLLRKSDTLLAGMFKNDEPTNFYLFQFLEKTLEKMLAQNKNTVLSILKLIDIVFGKNGWIADVLNKKTSEENRKNTFFYYLAKFSWRCKTDIQKLLDKNLETEYPVYNAIGKFKLSQPAGEMPASAGKAQAAPIVTPRSLSKYNNLLARTLEFSDLPQESKTQLVKLLNEFKKSPKKFEMEPKLNKAKSDFSDIYWKMYENCFLKIIATDLKSIIPGAMLHFGLLDETMVSKEELQVIDQAYSKNLNVDKPINVMTLPYFLEKIYKSECKPSISEMGESFTSVMSRQKRLTNKEKEASYLYQDTAEDKVRYEIREIASETMKLVYGSKKKAFPVLCSEAMLGKIDNIMLDPESASAQIDSVREKDFSAFFREIVVHHKFGSDIIKQEVIPNFVLYPGAGSRMMMWQELDGAKRNTKGRIFLPLFFNEKIDEALITIIGHFRWELQKVMAGGKWMDAVDGGLAGAYYDYINFYKKNSNLTPKAKEIVREFVKKTRSDRERFSTEYLNWLKFEYEGRIKLNNASREIFYRYCPFQKEARQEMAKKPIFANLEMKFQNRANTAILKAESRKKKFEKSSEKIPQEMLDYLNFLNK